MDPGIAFLSTSSATALPLHDGHAQKGPKLLAFLCSVTLQLEQVNISKWPIGCVHLLFFYIHRMVEFSFLLSKPAENSCRISYFFVPFIYFTSLT